LYGFDTGDLKKVNIEAMRSLVLSLLLAPALAADWKDDPIGQRMRQGKEEQAAVEAIDAAHDVLARFESLQRRYTQDGDFARYARDREAMISETMSRFDRLEDVSKDIQRAQVHQQMFNALGLASIVKGSHGPMGKKNLHEISARTIELSRSLHLQEQTAALKEEIGYFLIRDIGFFKAAEEEALRKRRLKIAAAAAALVLCAGAAFFLLRRRPFR
jgi:hypothetical protein